ncbi:hypothetical protein L6452_22639 [Arctium lappa]|uniref:Uncharacterized protein n=1 Tax=Arctium lappa TaxID=4217 RepID=A0ACB9B236_ARCLA|nr:hypothetical protein L6452_22639 [Arctium lappa]
MLQRTPRPIDPKKDLAVYGIGTVAWKDRMENRGRDNDKTPNTVKLKHQGGGNGHSDGDGDDPDMPKSFNINDTKAFKVCKLLKPFIPCQYPSLVHQDLEVESGFQGYPMPISYFSCVDSCNSSKGSAF